MPAVQDLSIRQLQYVVAVADTLGFHRAAERCNVSQPSLSAQVQQVEEVLGLQLFERDKRRVIVTPAGSDVVTRARRVLVELEDLLSSASRARDPLAGTFRVGVIPTVAPYLLPDVTIAWAREYPALHVEWREEPTEPLLRHLETGELDAALLAVVPELHHLRSALVTEDAFTLAVPLGHRLARQPEISLEDLDDEAVLLLDDGHCFRTQALSLCAKAGAHEAGFRATSLSTLAQMVSSGAGVTLLPAMAGSVENRRGQLAIRPFAAPAPGRTIALVWRPSSPYASTFEALAKTLRGALAGAVAHAAPGAAPARLGEVLAEAKASARACVGPDASASHSTESAPSVRASSRHQARTLSKSPGARR